MRKSCCTTTRVVNLIYWKTVKYLQKIDKDDILKGN